MESSEQLDQYCFDILMILYYEGKPLGFNELCRKTEKLFNFSRPTLSAHLKHLTSKKLVIKLKEKNSKLTLKPSKYAINPKASKLIPDVRPTIEKWEQLVSKRDFKSLAWHLHNDLATLCLLTLKYHLETLLNKEDAEKGLWLSQISLATFTKTLYQKIQMMLKDAKKEEINELLKEWDAYTSITTP